PPPPPAAPAPAAAPSARSAAAPTSTNRYPCSSGRPPRMRLGHQARTTAPGGRPLHKRNPPISRLPGYVLLLRILVPPTPPSFARNPAGKDPLLSGAELDDSKRLAFPALSAGNANRLSDRCSWV